MRSLKETAGTETIQLNGEVRGQRTRTLPLAFRPREVRVGIVAVAIGGSKHVFRCSARTAGVTISLLSNVAVPLETPARIFPRQTFVSKSTSSVCRTSMRGLSRTPPANACRTLAGGLLGKQHVLVEKPLATSLMRRNHCVGAALLANSSRWSGQHFHSTRPCANFD